MRLARITIWTHDDGRLAACLYPANAAHPSLVQIAIPERRDLIVHEPEKDCRDILASQGFVWRMECVPVYVDGAILWPPRGAASLDPDEDTKPSIPSARAIRRDSDLR